jgi:hypothetical protein
LKKASQLSDSEVQDAVHAEDEAPNKPCSGMDREQLAGQRAAITALKALREELGDREQLRAMSMLQHAEWRRDVQASITLAMETSPEEPGPLNSHMLVMKAFNTLDANAPEYLQHWVSYLNDLIWLEAQG